MELKSSSIMSDYNFAFLSLSAINKSEFNGYGINTKIICTKRFGDGFSA